MEKIRYRTLRSFCTTNQWGISPSLSSSQSTTKVLVILGVSCLFWPCFVSLLAAVSSDSLNLTALKICSPYNLLEEQAESLGYLATFIRKLSWNSITILFRVLSLETWIHSVHVSSLNKTKIKERLQTALNFCVVSFVLFWNQLWLLFRNY